MFGQANHLMVPRTDARGLWKRSQQRASSSLAGRLMLAAALISGAATATAQTSGSTSTTGPTVARGVIVQLKPLSGGATESPQSAFERLTTVLSDSGLDSAQMPTPVGQNGHMLHFNTPLSGSSLGEAMRRVQLNPQVAAAEPDVLVQPAALPNDPFYTAGDQWYLRPPSIGGPSAINAEGAWAITTGLPGQVIAVVDSGALFGHPDLAGKWLPGYDMASDPAISNDGDGRDPDASDPGDWVSTADTINKPVLYGCPVKRSSWHGTFIAGQLAGVSNNDMGVTGLNWNAKILPVRVSGKCGAWLSDVIDGIRWAAGLPVSGVPDNPNPAKVINLSFGGNSACTAAYQAAIDDATNAGSLVVVAAGNANRQLMRPASCKNVLAVGALRQDGLKTYYSSFGSNMGVMAPGGSAYEGRPRLYSTIDAGRESPANFTFGTMDGTSFAAPLAAGVASLMQALNPRLTPAELISRIQQSARPFPFNPAYPTCSVDTPVASACNCTLESCGPGILDAEGALKLSASPAVTIAPIDGDITPGTSVSLDGSASTGVLDSEIVSWRWTQVSGPPVGIQSADGPVARVYLPIRGTWVFQLSVTDAGGHTADNTVDVAVSALNLAETDPPGSGGGDTGGGGGASGWGWGLTLWAVALMAWMRRRRMA